MDRTIFRARTTGFDAERESRLRDELAKGRGKRTWAKLAAQCGYSCGPSAYGAAKRLGLLDVKQVDVSDL